MVSIPALLHMQRSLRRPMTVLQQQRRLKRCSDCVPECFPAVIACDKREAFAQGSEATKQSMPLRVALWIASLRSQ
jgi:hypothetical protein